MTQNGLVERDSLNVGSGKWASITKEAYRPSDLAHAVGVPVLQALALSISIGLSVMVLVSLFWHDVKLVMTSFAVVVPITMTVCLLDGFRWARNALESLEIWESESASGGSVDHATVKVELIENRDSYQGHGVGVGGRVIYELLETDMETLRMITSDNVTLSKRGLMDIGLSDSDAMRLVSQLIEYGYATREANNKPAVFTAKGKALCKSL